MDLPCIKIVIDLVKDQYLVIYFISFLILFFFFNIFQKILLKNEHRKSFKFRDLSEFQIRQIFLFKMLFKMLLHKILFN